LLAGPKGYLGISLIATFFHLSVISMAGQPHGALAISPDTQADAHADRPSLSLPVGHAQCPASGAGASCSTAPAAATPGFASLPAGMSPCKPDASKPAPSSPAACDGTVLESPSEPDAQASRRVQPSVPIKSIRKPAAHDRLTLAADRAAPSAGTGVVLVATAGASVTGTRSAIEIFDHTTGTLVGACAQLSRCSVAYTAAAGARTFVAFITPPTTVMPNAATTATSNLVKVSWIGVSFDLASPAIVGPRKPITLTASTTVEVGAAGYVLGFYDLTTGKRLTFCSRGTTCSTALTEPASGTHVLAAYVGPASSPSDIVAESTSVPATWLGVTLAANTTYPQVGGTVYLTATANADLTHTPWSIGIYDREGELIDEACKSGTSCSAKITLTSGDTQWYSAVIGATPTAVDATSPAGQILNHVLRRAALTNIQARSSVVKPTRLLWGVDSCKPLTGDTKGDGGLYREVVRGYGGTPDFWGRYLTTTPNCPGLSATEIQAAAYRHLGILPIYNDYDCSAVSGYASGQAYGTEATNAAARDGIPSGTVVMIDIEPPGPWCSGGVDAAFIAGWYDGVTLADYAPGYYGDSTAGSTFGEAWCAAVADRPEIATDSYLWSFQPSLLGRYTKLTAPSWAPHNIGCEGTISGWQYILSAGGSPDVDSDEALSTMPIWYPSEQS
jgi:hypothetical protein